MPARVCTQQFGTFAHSLCITSVGPAVACRKHPGCSVHTRLAVCFRGMQAEEEEPPYEKVAFTKNANLGRWATAHQRQKGPHGQRVRLPPASRIPQLAACARHCSSRPSTTSGACSTLLTSQDPHMLPAACRLSLCRWTNFVNLQDMCGVSVFSGLLRLLPNGGSSGANGGGGAAAEEQRRRAEHLAATGNASPGALGAGLGSTFDGGLLAVQLHSCTRSCASLIGSAALGSLGVVAWSTWLWPEHRTARHLFLPRRSAALWHHPAGPSLDGRVRGRHRFCLREGDGPAGGSAGPWRDAIPIAAGAAVTRRVCSRHLRRNSPAAWLVPQLSSLCSARCASCRLIHAWSALDVCPSLCCILSLPCHFINEEWSRQRRTMWNCSAYKNAEESRMCHLSANLERCRAAAFTERSCCALLLPLVLPQM